MGDTYEMRVAALRQTPCKTLIHVDNDVSRWLTWNCSRAGPSSPVAPVLGCRNNLPSSFSSISYPGLLRRAGMLLLERAQDLRARSSHCWLLVPAYGSWTTTVPPLRHVLVQCRYSCKYIWYISLSKKGAPHCIVQCQHEGGTRIIWFG